VRFTLKRLGKRQELMLASGGVVPMISSFRS